MGCCSGTDFTTSVADSAPAESQRVNYSFGMVLGVDDFKQEHAWLAGRDARALREAVGFGVLAGLDVGRDIDTLTLSVEPGLALAPDGRLIAVTEPQCAQLDKWLAGAGKQTPVVGGSRTLYVVLCPAETSGTPVPIPGEPCRDESAQQADSRWSDAFALKLSWERPSTEEDDALREFVAWLRVVPVHDAPVDGVDVAQFAQAVDELIGSQLGGPFKPPAAPPATFGGHTLVLPRTRYAEYLAAAFDVWTRRLRLLHLARHGPVQVGSEGKGSDEHALLLASVSLTLNDEGALIDPASLRVEPRGRPQLLHLRLLQEWLLANPEVDAPLDAHYVLGRPEPRLPQAQDLLDTFFGTPHRPGGVLPEGRVALPEERERGAIARVDRVGPALRRGETTALLTPALKYDGGSDGDYYGPAMKAPIPVHDGGTGQAATPANGQILVGRDDAFKRGTIAGKDDGRNIVVSIEAGEGASPDVVLLDTSQRIDTGASPSFEALTVTGGSRVIERERAGPALKVTGGADLDALTLDLGTGVLYPVLLAADTQHRVIAATPWQGGVPDAGMPQYYKPGQTGSVLRTDGGTGLSQEPLPQQLLVGRNDGKAGYVLADLKAGANVAIEFISLTTPAFGHTPPQQVGTLTISATGSSTTKVVGVGSVVATTEGDTVSVDTVQALDKKARPDFAGLSLRDPATGGATQVLGRNAKSGEVVAVARQVPLNLRYPDRADAELQADDEVLVFDKLAQFKLKLPDPIPATDNGRSVILKVSGTATSVAVSSVDGSDLKLGPGEAVTLVAAPALKQWLLVSSLRKG